MPTNGRQPTEIIKIDTLYARPFQSCRSECKTVSKNGYHPYIGILSQKTYLIKRVYLIPDNAYLS